MGRRKTKGSSMLLTIAIFGILTILGSSMLAVTTANYKMRITENKRVQNLYSAEAGLDMAYIELVKQVNKAIETAQTVEGEAFQDAYDEYIINILPSEVAGEYDVVGTDVKPVVSCKVETKSKNSKSVKEVLLISTYVKDDVNRIVSVAYDIETPDISFINKGELSGITKYSLATDKDLFVKNSSDLSVNGDIWVQGTMPIRNTAITLNEKYDGGVILENSRVKVSNDIATASNVKLLNSEMNFNVDTEEKNIYAENIFVGKGNNIKNIKNSLAGDKLSAYLANDLVIDSEDAIVTMGNFYGFNDVNTIDKNNLDMMNEMARGSSSIIINSMEWPKDNAKIDIRTSAYIMGAAYINTSTPYQTGESVALKGNYEAYTAPVNGNYNESQYEYFDPLVLITKKLVEKKDANGNVVKDEKGNTVYEYKEMDISDKKEHFIDYAEDEFNASIRKSNISFPKETYTAGAFISKGEIKSYDIGDKITEIAKFKNDYVKEVYYMGKEKEDAIYGDDEFNRKIIEYKDEAKKIPLYTVEGQINWTNVDKIIADNSNKNKFRIFTVSQGKKDLTVILNSDERSTIEITKQGNGGNVSVKIGGQVGNNSLKSTDNMLIVTKGEVVCRDLSELNATIFSQGEINIENCSGNIGAKYSLKDWLKDEIIKLIFSTSSEVDTEVNMTVQDLITRGKWTLVK
ncbi:hypothetical protein [Clostridium culturomicium]|uniref:hypothetical protein n=1 Tax=Clostridium culturomicium TaxID=1499683 RepID=UPI003857A122